WTPRLVGQCADRGRRGEGVEARQACAGWRGNWDVGLSAATACATPSRRRRTDAALHYVNFNRIATTTGRPSELVPCLYLPQPRARLPDIRDSMLHGRALRLAILATPHIRRRGCLR